MKKAKVSNSVVAKLVHACEVQEKTIDKLLSTIKSGGISMVERVKRSYRKRRRSSKLEAATAKKSNSDFFLESLKQIGRPATTWEIAGRLKRMNPYFKSLSRNKKKFMQIVYSSASYLSKEGLIDRKPVGKKSFEYTIHGKAAA